MTCRDGPGWVLGMRRRIVIEKHVNIIGEELLRECDCVSQLRNGTFIWGITFTALSRSKNDPGGCADYNGEL